jgi:uncharacterized membrane protein
MPNLSFPLDEVVAEGASAALLVTYHVFLRLRSWRDPLYTVQATNAVLRVRWVSGVMKQGKDILAIQTLRNSTMAATFLASTSVVLVMGVLNLIAKGDALASASGPKLLLLLLDLFVAFFGFAMSIRLYNHVGYMLGMPTVSGHDNLEPTLVAAQLNRAASYHSVGMRAFYFLVPLVFWFFGAWALLGASAGLVLLLFSNDRAPRSA